VNGADDDPAATLLTTEQAAAAARVTPRDIQNWAGRGLLRPLGRDGRGRNLFRELDVLYAERSTRRAPRLRALLEQAAAVLDAPAPGVRPDLARKPPQDHANAQVD